MIRIAFFLLLYLVVNSVSMGQKTTEKSHKYKFSVSYGPSYTKMLPHSFIYSGYPEGIKPLDVSARYGSLLQFDILRKFSKNRFWGFSFSRQQHSVKVDGGSDFGINFIDYRFVSIRDYYQLFIGNTFGKYFDMCIGVGMFMNKQPKIVYNYDGTYDFMNHEYFDDLFFSINMGYMYPLDKHVQIGVKARYYSGYMLELSTIDALTLQPSIQISF